MSTFTLSLLGSRTRPKRFRIENGHFHLDEQVLLCVDAIEIRSFCELLNLTTLKGDARILVILSVACKHDRREIK